MSTMSSCAEEGAPSRDKVTIADFCPTALWNVNESHSSQKLRFCSSFARRTATVRTRPRPLSGRFEPESESLLTAQEIEDVVAFLATLKED